MDLQLDGKTALVTGASAGIGRAACALFAAEGVRLAIAGRRIEALEETGDLVEAAGGARPHILQGDLGDREQAAEIARRALAAFDGRVDILLNNAGASVPLDDPWDEEAWERSQRLNFDAARHVARVIAPAMQANGWGRIVNLTGAMVAPAPNAAAPAKAALQSWSRSLSLQLAPHGVTVNTIAPGRIATEQIRNKLHPTEESRRAFIDRFIPAGRFGEPEELAVVAVFLASPLAGYVNGAAIPVDGAMTRIG